MTKPLCPWCQARYERALAHDLHPEPETAARLHADLAMVCDPRFCPKPETKPQETAR